MDIKMAKYMAGSFIEEFVIEHEITEENLQEKLEDISESDIYELVNDAVDMYLHELGPDALHKKYDVKINLS